MGLGRIIPWTHVVPTCLWYAALAVLIDGLKLTQQRACVFTVPCSEPSFSSLAWVLLKVRHHTSFEKCVCCYCTLNVSEQSSRLLELVWCPLGREKLSWRKTLEFEADLSNFSFRWREMILVQYMSRSRGSFICTMTSSTLLWVLTVLNGYFFLVCTSFLVNVSH